ncbi:autotransporter-associated beta strand repeat-containing protein [Paucibacter sp. PLA-PC-4]|uniref:beta strand repeat-containing protein n=1 Tax=Paucibacter sp. PLA-PC-4 TaxID=2993655 RepID=UPI00224B5ABB|nr:autotransporter-associated beta strand repeat-containing protein [Paucibacter sp. PLA-PC-4]MCX2864047.1 autotransporter-associated beta strand repeat-containing protein [Paucibacter sp. PLA-PC-4]
MRRHLALQALPAALSTAFALVGLLPAPGGAAVHLWTGSASTKWSEAANWTGGLPVAGGELLMDSAARPASFNDLAGGLTLLGLTLGVNAAAPTLSGNALRFGGSGAYLRMLSNGGHGTVDNALALDGTLNITGGPSAGSQLFLRGDIGGSGGLTVAGGRTVLSGNNSFAGITTVASGAALGIAGGALAGSSGIEVATGGELQFVSANVSTSLNRPVALGGRLSSSAADVSTPFGKVAGASVAGAITLTARAEVVALAGTAPAPVRLVVNGPVDRAGQTLTVATAGANNMVSVATVTGAGELVLRPNGGTVSIGDVAGSGELAAIGPAGTATVGSLGGDGRVLVNFDDSFGRLIITGALDGQRDLDVRNGTLTLATNTPRSLTGQITLRGNGTLDIGRESALGSASPVLSFEGGGRLLVRDGFHLARDIVTTGGNGTLQLGGGSNTVSSNISGDGGFSLIGGIITATGNNSFSGGLGVFNDGTINSNGQPNTTTLRFVHDGNLGQAGQGIKLGGSLALPDGYDLSRPLTLAGTAAGINGSGDHTISSTISGDGRLNLGGAARYVLAGSASHSGGVTLAGQSSGQAAVLVIDGDARLGAATGVLNIGRASGFFSLPGTLVAAGHLDIAVTRSTSFRDMTVDSNGFDVVFNQPINGLGMTKAGAGRWTLNTANTNSSGDNRVEVQQGTLALGVNEALGTRSLVNVATGAQLALGGRLLTITSLDSAAGSSVDLGAGGTLRPLFGTLDGILAGQGHLVVGRAGFSPGAVTLGGANGFTGTVEVTNGSRLTLNHAQALGAAGNLILLDNGSLEVTNRLAVPLVITAATNLQIGPGGAGFVANGQSIIVQSALGGGAPLRIQGGSLPGSTDKFDVRLAHSANSFSGDLVLGDPQGFGSAVLGITADGSLGAAGNRLVLGRSFYDGETTRSAQGGLRAWDSLTLAATRSVLLDGESGSDAGFIDTNGHTLVVAGSIGELASGLGLLKTGEGTLVLNGVQAYTGLTQIKAGTLGGRGEVERLAVQAATLAPGDSAGLFSVRQDLSFSGGALLSLTLGGPTRDSGHGALSVGALLDLGQDTTLRLSLSQGFSAQAGQQFDLLDWGILQGQFSTIDSSGLVLAQGMRLDVSRLYIDGVVGVTAVPEPQSWALLLSGVLGLLAWRRRELRPA